MIPGGALFSQLNKGVKDAMVESTALVECQFMTKTCKKAKLKNKILHTKRKRKKETITDFDQDAEESSDEVIQTASMLTFSRVLTVTCPRAMLEICALGELRSRFRDLREVNFRVVALQLDAVEALFY